MASFPMLPASSALHAEASSAAVAFRCAESSFSMRTLISSCALRERFVSSMTDGLTPARPTRTTGSRECASPLRYWRCFEVSAMAAHGSRGFLRYPCGVMKLTACVLLFFVASAALAQDLINPDRPGIADGSSVVGRGIFQIEAGLERDHGSDGRSLPTPLLLRFGVSKELEFCREGDGYIHADAANGFAPL